MNRFLVTLQTGDVYIKILGTNASDTYCKVCSKTILKTENAFIIRDEERRHGKGIACSKLCVDTWILQKL